MDKSCLLYRLSNEERRTFRRDRNPPDRGRPLARHRSPHCWKRRTVSMRRTLAQGQDPHKALFYPNFIPDSPLFQDLVDYPKILPRVWGILGWNIYLYHAHLIVTPPCGQPQDDKTFGWHQDSGRVNAEIECHPRPRLIAESRLLPVGYERSGHEATSGSFRAAIATTRWSARPMVSVSRRAQCLCWRSRAPPSSSTDGSGTPPARTGRTSPARCSSTATAIAGFAPRTI